jgi:hypothetical protein
MALFGAMGWAGIGILSKPDGWWVGPLLMLLSSLLMTVTVVLLNALFTYRVEIDARGLRIIGNFYTHDLTWQEITLIQKRHNYRAPGYHVRIEVDGSRAPRRHWSNLWLTGYFVHPGMEKGGIELTAYLKRKRREYLKSQRAITAVGEAE